jgi:GMP synthase-like glutamine amidotransferase
MYNLRTSLRTEKLAGRNSALLSKGEQRSQKKARPRGRRHISIETRATNKIFAHIHPQFAWAWHAIRPDARATGRNPAPGSDAPPRAFYLDRLIAWGIQLCNHGLNSVLSDGMPW